MVLPPPGSRGAASSGVKTPPNESGLNAKERRRLRRAQEAKQQDTQEARREEGTKAAASKEAGLNAKERRRLRRAREGKQQETAASTAGESGLKAKERLRRAEESAAQREAPAPGASVEKQGLSNEARKKRKRTPLVAFVGQLSFETSAERLEKFFAEAGVPGSARVRLLTDRESGKSRGMAFVECDSAEALHAVVSLHRSTIDGRRINVEKSAGGGKSAKRQRVADKRSKQQAALEDTVDRVVADFVKDGTLRPDEIDDGVRKLLARRSGRVAQAALAEYCSLEGRHKFHNPAAYLTKIVTRIATDEDVANKSTILNKPTKKPDRGAARRSAKKPASSSKPAASTPTERDAPPPTPASGPHSHDLAAIFSALRD